MRYIEPQLVYLNHANNDGDQSQRVENQLSQKDLSDSQGFIILAVDQHEEEDHADNGYYQNKDTEEKPFVCISAIHRIMMR